MNIQNISKPEKLFYFSVWILAVLYALYCFASDTYFYFQNYDDKYGDFINDFYYLSGRRDQTDLEWEGINYLIKHFFPWILLYIIVSELIRSNLSSLEVLKSWQISFTVVYLLIQVGYIMVFLIILQPVIFTLICNNNRSKIAIWLCNGGSLIFSTYIKQLSLNTDFTEDFGLGYHQMYYSVLCLFWMNLKCTSYFLEKQSSKRLLDCFSYCLYPPTIYCGPFIPLKDYLNIYEPTILPFYERLGIFIVNLSRCLFWFVFTNFCLHYVYVGAVFYHLKFVKSLDSWSLYGYGYAMGQFFHIKYVVLYGLSTSFASFENVCVPHLPRCIGRVHLYSDMWKYFDPGLYKFLVRYIYIPMREICRFKLFASFMCFLFVYLWHGVEMFILIWTILNYLGIVLEYLSNTLYKRYYRYGKKVGPVWTRRIKCAMASPLLVLSAVSNFYFFAGTEVGDIFTDRILNGNFKSNIILLLILYCCCQVSTEVRRIDAKRM